MKKTSLIAILFFLSFYTPRGLSAKNLNESSINSTNAAVNPVTLTVIWTKTLGQITADHWGVNDQCFGTKKVNTKMANFFLKLNPGVIRLHEGGLVTSWVDNVNKTWDLTAIKNAFDNSKDTYKYGNRVMVNLDGCPSFISTTYPLTIAQEDQLAAFFAQLPVIVKQMGYHIDLYEFLNEKEQYYSSDLSSYWRLLNKIAVAMKAADSTIKCGGPAASWPNSDIYQGFIDNCKNNMDFISYHTYARGASFNGFPIDDVLTKASISGCLNYRSQANASVPVLDYLKSKNVTKLETFMDEFNIQSVWTPEEPLHQSWKGAAWMACLVKTATLKGITGLNVWNVEDSGAYGLNYTSAPANLYQQISPYLRGSIVNSIDATDVIEIFPVLAANGNKSILLINRTGQIRTAMNVKSLFGSTATLYGLRLDSTTLVQGEEYTTQIINPVSTDVVLNPYGMVLLTQNVITGISDVEKMNLSLSPNPVTNILNINTDVERFDIRIYNSAGILVMQDINKKKLDVSKLKPGVCFVEIKSDSKYYIGKIIKTNN